MLFFCSLYFGFVICVYNVVSVSYTHLDVYKRQVPVLRADLRSDLLHHHLSLRLRAVHEACDEQDVYKRQGEHRGLRSLITEIQSVINGLRQIAHGEDAN